MLWKHYPFVIPSHLQTLTRCCAYSQRYQSQANVHFHVFYLCCTMGQDHLNGVARLTIDRDVTITVELVYRRVAQEETHTEIYLVIIRIVFF